METPKDETRKLSSELRIFLQILVGDGYDISPTGIVRPVEFPDC